MHTVRNNIRGLAWALGFYSYKTETL